MPARVRSAVLYALALIVMLAIVHPDAIFRGHIYGSADAANQDAFAAVGDAWLAERGDYPEWNPYLFTGMPTYGSTAYRKWVYPFGEIFNVFQNRLGFPPLTWMLVHLLFGGAGMIWLTGRWGVPPAGRILAAAAWLLFPKLVAWGVHGHGSKLVAAMYLPWVVGWTLEAFSGRPRRAAGWIAVLLGLQFLRAHPQICYYTLLAVGVTALAVWISAAFGRGRDGGLPVRATVWGVAALVVAVLIGAVSLLPGQEYVGASVRGVSEGGGAAYDYTTGWSLSPRELGTFVFPAASGFGQATYQGPMPFNDYPNTFGFVVLVLVAVGLGDRRRRLTASLAALFVMAVLVSFGKHLPVLYDPFYHLLPWFDTFRIPSMILVLAAFAAAALAALGAARVGADDGMSTSRLARLGYGLGLVGVLCGLGALGPARGFLETGLASLAAAAGRPDPAPVLLEAAWDIHRADLGRIALVLVLFGGGCVVAARRPDVGRRRLAWLLPVLVVIELIGVDLNITHPERNLRAVGRDGAGRGVLVQAATLSRPWNPGATSPGSDSYARLAERVGHQRVWPLGRDAGTNDGMSAGVRSLGGYHPAKPAASEALRRQLSGRVASWLGASWVTADQPLPAEATSMRPDLVGDLYVYPNAAALPRARLVHDWRPAGDETLEGFLQDLQAGRVDHGVVTLDATPTPAPVPVDDAAPVAFVDDGLDEIVLRAAPTAPAVLVLADLVLPGWSVEVDGEERPLLVADHVLRGVALEAGEHEVRFVYRDPSLRRSLVLTIAGIVMASILLFLGIRETPAKGEA